MDYVVGSVAALVTGNVTPNRPRLMKRALTPTKHQPSPNVTPKSEFVEDRSIFLSPSMQKKKAIVKKSPKRIFQNPDLETTDNGDSNLSLTSPKADKVKKHLKDDLESNSGANNITKSPKKKKNKNDSIALEVSSSNVSELTANENTPKKKKKKNKSISENAEKQTTEQSETVTAGIITTVARSPKKMKQRRKSTIDDESNKENDHNDMETEPVNASMADKSPTKQKNTPKNSENTHTDKEATVQTTNNTNPKKKNKKRKKKPKPQLTENKSESMENIAEETNKENVKNNQGTLKKKNKKRKKSKSQQDVPQPMETDQPSDKEEDDETDVKQSKKVKATVNPNAITDKESDSEHESDNEIESENEEINKKVFESEPTADESSDEEDEESKKDQPRKQKTDKPKEENKEKLEVNTEEEIKRTLFVGNVPFSAKCKKEIKKIFSKHGQIKTIRIRTVPVKDGRYTPKLAVIKNELHPERTTVNVYIKYADEESVEKALAENNTVLNDHHLRVSRSSHTGVEHDPKCAIFVGNMPFAMEDEALRQMFEKCGEIESVRIIRDKATNAGKGFGYVNFATKDGVELALALTEEDLTVKNRIIRVKRCTQFTDKQKQTPGKAGFKKQFNQKPNQGHQREQGDQRLNQGVQRGKPGFQRGKPGFQRGNQGGPIDNLGGPRGNQGGQRGFQGGQRGFQGGQRGFQGGQRGLQGGQKGFQGGQRLGSKDEEVKDGAFRRIMHKRKNQDGNAVEEPPNKKQKNINQPIKQKKSLKEFVGLTAEKKKKRKFDKGQKKKKALSEILTK